MRPYDVQPVVPTPAALDVPMKRSADPFDLSYKDAEDSDDDIDVRIAGKDSGEVVAAAALSLLHKF